MKEDILDFPTMEGWTIQVRPDASESATYFVCVSHCDFGIKELCSVSTNEPRLNRMIAIMVAKTMQEHWGQDNTPKVDIKER